MAARISSLLFLLAATTAKIEAVRVDDGPAEGAAEGQAEEGGKGATTMSPTNSFLTQKRMGEAADEAGNTSNCTPPEVVPNVTDKADDDGEKETGTEPPQQEWPMPVATTTEKPHPWFPKDGEVPAHRKKGAEDEASPSEEGAAEEGAAEPASLEELDEDPAKQSAASKEAVEAATAKGDAAAAEAIGKEAEAAAPAEGGKKTGPAKMHPYELKERLDAIKADSKGAWNKWGNGYIPENEMAANEANEKAQEDPEEQEKLDIAKAKAGGRMHPFEVKERIEAIQKDHKGSWNKWAPGMTAVPSDTRPRS